MRAQFDEFYPLENDELAKLWQNAVFVFDTNVLLELYRLPKMARHELLEVMRTLAPRSWIPHHVGLEFNMRRPDAIANSTKVMDEKSNKIDSTLMSLIREIKNLNIDKHTSKDSSDAILKNLSDAHKEFSEFSTQIRENTPTVGYKDPIRDQLDNIFGDSIGDPYESSKLAEIIKEGDERYKLKIAPGFMDVDKDKDENPSFCYAGQKYPRKFGDLIIWLQTMEYCRANGIKDLIFVTGDKKEDWWWKRGSATIGPRPDLCREARDRGGLDRFWMYSPVQFGKFARDQLKAVLSDESLRDIKLASKFPSMRAIEFDNETGKIRSSENTSIGDDQDRSRIARVASWYQDTFGNVTITGGFPDLLYRHEDATTGLEVFFLQSEVDDLFFDLLRNEVRRGKNYVSDSEIDFFEIVLLFPNEESLMESKCIEQVDRLIGILKDESVGYDVEFSIAFFTSDGGMLVQGMASAPSGYDSFL